MPCRRSHGSVIAARKYKSVSRGQSHQSPASPLVSFPNTSFLFTPSIFNDHHGTQSIHMTHPRTLSRRSPGVPRFSFTHRLVRPKRSFFRTPICTPFVRLPARCLLLNTTPPTHQPSNIHSARSSRTRTRALRSSAVRATASWTASLLTSVSYRRSLLISIVETARRRSSRRSGSGASNVGRRNESEKSRNGCQGAVRHV